ncbi:MAG: HAMP domain-containing histidine kinase [Clostridia bacterium]|nr:HAMP domain-containing histidine kinase [Clostridia bacterium]
MKIKRFKNGFQFFSEKENLGIGLAVSGIIVIFSCVNTNENYISAITTAIIIIGSLISAIGLVIWIRRKITMLYRKRLESRAEVHYQAMLEEKDKYIEQLLKSNEFLSKVVHRDNHLMSALQHTIGQYLNSNDKSEKERILGEILTMAEERSKIIRKEQISSKVLPSTGVSMIDGTLGELYIKAAAHNIDFDVTVSEQLHYLVNNILSQTEIQTLLCDHIKDAIIAVESAGHISGKILVSFAMPDSIYEIAVKDNGIDFDADILQKLGNERVTTHAGLGGSGIGFVTTFETLRKVKASLIITEYKEKQPFSKSVVFRFDGQNQFILRTYRKSELLNCISRDDTVIIS